MSALVDELCVFMAYCVTLFWICNFTGLDLIVVHYHILIESISMNLYIALEIASASYLVKKKKVIWFNIKNIKWKTEVNDTKRRIHGLAEMCKGKEVMSG